MVKGSEERILGLGVHSPQGFWSWPGWLQDHVWVSLSGVKASEKWQAGKWMTVIKEGHRVWSKRMKGEVLSLWKCTGLRAAVLIQENASTMGIQLMPTRFTTLTNLKLCWSLNLNLLPRGWHTGAPCVSHRAIPELLDNSWWSSTVVCPQKEQASTESLFFYSLSRKFFNITQVEQRLNAQHSNVSFFSYTISCLYAFIR